MPQVELHLETAIDAAPGSPRAVRAYELLESRMQERYGAEMPPEIEEHLEKLGRIVGSG